MYVGSDGLLEDRNSELPTLSDMDKLHSYEWGSYPETAPSEPDPSEPDTAAEEGNETTNISKWGNTVGESNFDRTFDYVATTVGDDGNYAASE